MLVLPALHAADTLRVDLRQADSIFLADSYQLLAAEMQVGEARARIIQAGLYPNPVFSASFNAYDPENRRAFHTGRSGQKTLELEQLILLGGKRRAEIAMARADAAIAELVFQDLVRQLRFRLHSDLFAISQQRVLLAKYDGQLAMLDTVLATYEVQVARGNVPLRDLVRLKGVYLNLNNDRAEIRQQYAEAQAAVQSLLQRAEIIEPVFDDADMSAYIRRPDLAMLEAEAFRSRPDLQMIRENRLQAERYVDYQKRLAIPDVNLSLSYDQRSGAFGNEINLGVSVPLPFWNRNQGNIAAAQFQARETTYLLNALETEIRSSLRNSLMRYRELVSEYDRATALYNEDFETTLAGMHTNFLKKNVSLIEFVDFFESYNETLAEMTRIRIQLAIAAEYINLLIGKSYF